MLLLLTLTTWLQRHDVLLSLAAVWVLAVSAVVLAVVKIVSWSVLMAQVDQTDVGRSLKQQKVVEGLAWLCVSILYQMTLLAYYAGHEWAFWTRTALRLALSLSIIGAAITGIRFIYHLLREVRRDRSGYLP